MEHADPIESQRSLERRIALVVLVLAVLGSGAWLWFRHADARDEARQTVWLARSSYRLSVTIRSKTIADEEHAFTEACKRCASAQECERDRLVIAAGRASADYNPCD